MRLINLRVWKEATRLVGLGALVAMVVASAGCTKEAKVENHTEKGDAFYADGDYEKARIEYLNVTRLNPTNAHAFAQIGNIFYENGMALKAGAFFSRAMELGEADPQVRARRAVLIAMGDRAQAEEEALKALDGDPAQEEAVLLIADLASDEAKIKSAESKLAELRSAHGEQALYTTAEAVLDLKSRRVDAAQRKLEATLDAHPDFAPAHLILSSIYFSQSNTVDGATALKRAAELSPPRSNRQIRYINYLLKDDKEAGLAKIDEVLRLAPDYVPARLRKAQIAFADKDYEVAKREVNSIVSRDPENIESRQLQAQMYLAMKETEKARDIMSDLVKMYPGAAQLWYQAALTSVAGNDVERGLSEIEKAYELNVKLPQVVLLRGRLLMSKGRFDEAIRSIEQFVTDSPKFAAGYLQLADALIRSGQADKALAVYRDYENNFPKDPRGAHLQGLSLVRQEKLGEARAAFGRALDASANYFPSVEHLAQLDINAEVYDSAAARVQDYLVEKPDSAAGHYLLGRVNLAAKRFAEAEKNFETAIDRNPQLENAYFALVQIYNETDRKEEAKTKLVQLLEEKPTDLKALMTMGIILTEDKQYQNAADRYERLLAAHTEFTPALNNLAYIYSEHLDKLDRAYVLGRKAQQLLPEDPKVGDTLGWILYHRGEYIQALVHLEESAAKLAQNSEVLYHLGMNHYRLGNASRASDLLEKSVASAEDDAKWLGDAKASLNVLLLDVSNEDENALAKLQMLANERPNDVVVLTRLAQVQEALNDDAAALANYKKARQLVPEAVEAMVGEARIQIANGNVAEAMSLARKVRTLSEESGVALEIGRIVFAAKDYPYAYAVLQDAIEPNDATVEALFAFADVAIAVGQLEPAIASLDRVLASSAEDRDEAELRKQKIAQAKARSLRGATIQTGDDDLLGAFLTARMQAEAGDTGKAIAAYQKIVGDYPQFSPAMKQLAIELVKNAETVASAEKWARKARESMPNDPELSVVLGEAAFAKEDYRYATDILSSAARSISDDPGLFLLLARSQAELKQVAQATASIEKAKALPLTAEQQQQVDALSKSLLSQ